MVMINGESRNIAGQNLYQYLKEEGFDFNRIVVERNYEILQRDDLEKIVIMDDDTIEVLNFVGGG